MGVPQIIMLCIGAMDLLLTANLHGKPKEGNHSFWVESIGVACQIWLLYWGGFFRV